MTRALLAAALAIGCFAEPASAHMVPLGGSGNGLRIDVPAKSLAELKFKGIVRQGYDVSCGAAAAATILHHYYGETDLTEKDLIEAMLRVGDKERIQQQGFSMLEIKKAVEERGYVVSGYRMGSPEELGRLKVPALTLINVRGYAHFVVVKAVERGLAYIADPAFGNIVRPLSEFESGWDQIVLLFVNEQRERNGEFVMDQTVKAPIEQTIRLIDRTRTPAPRLQGEF